MNNMDIEKLVNEEMMKTGDEQIKNFAHDLLVMYSSCIRDGFTKQQAMSLITETDHIYAGARAILINKEPRIYKIVELIANKVNLTEDGLFFAVKDIKTDEIIGAKFDDLRFGSRKRDKKDEDYYKINEWINIRAGGYISDYDGDAYFCDDEYVYYYPDPFNSLYFKNDAVDCFSGVIFYGK